MSRSSLFLGVQCFAAFSLKLYVLCARGDAASTEEVDWASRVLADRLSSLITENERDYSGFAIIHKGTEGFTLSAYWWVDGCVLCHDHFRHPFNGVDPIPHMRSHVVGCVWELALINHEQNAWRRTMMSGQPDLAAYFRDCYPGERQDSI